MAFKDKKDTTNTVHQYQAGDVIYISTKGLFGKRHTSGMMVELGSNLFIVQSFGKKLKLTAFNTDFKKRWNLLNKKRVTIAAVFPTKKYSTAEKEKLAMIATGLFFETGSKRTNEELITELINSVRPATIKTGSSVEKNKYYSTKKL